MLYFILYKPIHIVVHVDVRGFARSGGHQMKKIDLKRRLLAIGLGLAVTFVSLPYMYTGGNAVIAEAAAAPEYTVSYQVQVFQDDVDALFDTVVKNSTPQAAEGGTAETPDLKYDASLEKLAIERAKDLALFYDLTRPDGTSGTLVQEDGTSGKDDNSRKIDEEVIADSLPSDWSVDTARYHTAGIGHVKYNDKDYYCMVMSKNTKGASDRAQTPATRTPVVTRKISQLNTTGLYAVYRSDKTADSNEVRFSGDRAAGTVKLLLGLNISQSLPIVNFGIKTKNSDHFFAISDKDGNEIAGTVQSGNAFIRVSDDKKTMTGIAKGDTSLSFSAGDDFGNRVLTIPYTVSAADLTAGSITLDQTVYTATGGEITPKPVVRYGEQTLRENTDYILTYQNNKPATSITSPVTATVTATGTGNYTGSISTTFQIGTSAGGNLSAATISLASTEDTPTYDGKAKEPKVTVMLGNSEVPSSAYDITYSDNINASTRALVVVKAKSGTGTSGKYKGSKRFYFTILPASIDTAQITLSSSLGSTASGTAVFRATGRAVRPNVTVVVGSATLTATKDYTLSYANNSPAASISTSQTATVTVTGRGNYTGTKSADFEIQPGKTGNMATADVQLSGKTTLSYDGKEKKPTVTVTLNGKTVPSSAYELSYTDNVNAGIATVYATAKEETDSEYTGTAAGTFEIKPASLGNATFTFSDALSGSTGSTLPKYAYTGSQIKPEPVIKVGSETLVKDTDFTYSYVNNVSIGKNAKVIITGKGNYASYPPASKNFEISGGDITSGDVSILPSQTFTYNGQQQNPTFVQIKVGGNILRNGIDYTVSQMPVSVVPGTYTFTVTGKGDFAADRTSSASTASGTNNANSNSTAGKLTLSYVINPKNVEDTFGQSNGVTVTGLKRLTFNGAARTPEIEVRDAETTEVLVEGTDFTRTDSDNTYPGTASVKLDFKGNYTGTLTQTYSIRPKKTSIASVTSIRKQATVTINPVSGSAITYQVKRGTNKKVTKNTRTVSTTGNVISFASLKSGRTYYFKVRSFVLGTDGRRIYSKWSKVKSVRVK